MVISFSCLTEVTLCLVCDITSKPTAHKYAEYLPFLSSRIDFLGGAFDRDRGAPLVDPSGSGEDNVKSRPPTLEGA